MRRRRRQRPVVLDPASPGSPGRRNGFRGRTPRPLPTCRVCRRPRPGCRPSHLCVAISARTSVGYDRRQTRYQNVLACRGRREGTAARYDERCPLAIVSGLNRSELSGCRVGRTWRMTHADVEDLIERHRNHALPRVDVRASRPDFLDGLTPTSRRRLDVATCDRRSEEQHRYSR
jgi:hypothetical protein